MKSLYLLISIYIGLVLSGCATVENKDFSQPPTKTASATTHQPLKNPIAVALFQTGSQPHEHYEIIGKETVSKFNLGGIKRQEAIINDKLRQLAASIGGDAIINIQSDKQSITGTIISYDKKLA